MEKIEYNYEFCKQLATKAHEGQHRKFGHEHLDYIVHPIAVAEQFSDPMLKCVAVLHDVIEDTYMDGKRLIAEGVPEDVVKLVEVLSHRKNETYWEYLDRVLEEPKAILVKIMDIENNMLTVPESLKERRYKPALEILYRRVATHQRWYKHYLKELPSSILMEMLERSSLNGQRIEKENEK